MGIPPGVPVKAAKSIGPCPPYCRADCPGPQRPAHPPGSCPGLDELKETAAPAIAGSELLRQINVRDEKVGTAAERAVKKKIAPGIGCIGSPASEHHAGAAAVSERPPEHLPWRAAVRGFSALRPAAILREFAVLS